jgi:hypothetical protein
LSFASAAHAFDKPPFPRLGGFKTSAPQAYEDPAYQAQLAKLNVAVLNNFPGWEAAHHTTFKAVVDQIKARNPNTLIFMYANMNEAVKDNPGVWIDVYNKLNANKWWLYSSGTSGLPVTSTWGPNFGITNYTMGAATDSSGKRYLDWYPTWSYNTFLKSAPNVDGVLTDNFFWKPRVNGDWNRDGVIDSKDSAIAQKLHREGMAKYIAVWRQILPGKYQLGNGDWGNPSSVAPEYDQLLNGSLLERAIGDSWSPEGKSITGAVNSWGSWKLMMQHYWRLMHDTADPKLVIFQQWGVKTDYQAFRYGFASCLMDDGYYDFAVGKYTEIPWFDEYDAKLGQAVTPPPRTPWKNGVWRRDFENGIALVNPRGNGQQTVDLGGTFKRISGKQDTTVNNGATATQITLKDRDGIVLMRDKPMKRPAAPTMITTSTN